MSNPSLGTVACPTCGADGADVRQSKRRGAHLYWQCAACGLNQPTGAVIQERLWRETEWHTGAEPTRPANVTADLARNTPTEFDPTEPEPEAEPEPSSQPSARPSRARGLGVLLLASLGLGVFLSQR
ncbi:hypothetical protein [Billgrantia bachuensis]|uniref:Uncharacterized protein n=1 Tax=Billgrantia bachuensis TaxID=2717286 RepID=A0ABX0PL44_9GAMM|nr:hypothetical protein [Halomonas bachuensis]NIC03981.1 hypothetical protein [Halomonas bachuensis]